MHHAPVHLFNNVSQDSMKIYHFTHRREWTLAALAVLTIVAQVYLDLKVPEYMERITQTIATPGKGLADMATDGALMVAAALASMVCAIITGFCTAIIGTTLSRRMRGAVYDQAFDLSSAEVNHIGTDSLITRTTNDVTQIQMFVVMGLQVSIKAPIMAIWASSKIASQSWTWTIPTGVAVLVTLLVLGVAMALAIPRMVRMQKITDHLNRVTREHLTGLRVIRAYTTSSFHEKRFEAVNTDLRNNTLLIASTMAFIMPMLTAIMTALSLSIYVLGATLIDGSPDPQERLTLFGQIVAFSTYALLIVTSFMMMTMVFVMGPRALVSWRRIREVLRTTPSIQDGGAQVGTAPAGTLEFQNVSFRYPDADGDTLHSVSFSAAPGETVALIGSTGSGKSTLVNLVPRFADVREGAVLVDGVDVRDWNQKDLRARIAFAPQKATMFSGTVASNIALGQGLHPVDAATVVSAADAAAATSFLESKEGAFAATVAQNGKNFSGGQKQRLSMARAFARGGHIMIFDDSFSALDYATERAIRTQLRTSTKGAILLIVAQRIGTVRDADRIIVLDKGRIVGSGTHEELMATNEVYQDIALSQLSEEELAQ